MLDEIRLLCRCLNELSGDCLRESVIEAIQFALSENKDFSGGEYDKYLLLCILMEMDDQFIKHEYDPTKNFKLIFFDKE